LNTTRGRIVIVLLIVTGITSMALGKFAPDEPWTLPATLLLFLTFVIGTALVYAPEGGRLLMLVISAPAVGALALGLTVLPQYLTVLMGAGVGWIVAGMFLFRRQTPREVSQAIKHMRKGEYKEALTEIDAMIKRDRDNPEHYRLRAMIFRLDSRLDRAKRDYDTMFSLAAEGDTGDAIRAEAYDGLSEVHLQAGRLAEANQAALNAHQLFPKNWVPLYNLGLINDRIGDATAVVNYLSQAFDLRIPDERQRLLAHLYLARAYKRLGDTDAALKQVKRMDSLWNGLEALEKLFADEQSAPLSAVLAADAQTARALLIEEIGVSEL
jgi:Flp pilus assembly protein TadD